MVLTWEGTEPKKPSILLNSHMDVVPVFEVSTLLSARMSTSLVDDDSVLIASRQLYN